MRLCFWARSSLAPVCVTASLRGLRRSSQQVGRGTRNQSFRERQGGGGVGGSGRRGRGEAEAADDHDPAAAGKLLGSRRRRHRLGPHPKRAPPGLVGSGETSPRDRNRALRAREESCAQARNGEPSVAGTGPEGRGRTRVSQDRSLSLRGTGVRSESVWWREGPEYGRRGSSRRALSPCPPAIWLRLARAPSLTSGGRTRVGCVSGRGCAGVCMSFPGSQGLATERPHR